MLSEKKFHEYAITGGPNKLDLMLAVFDPFPCNDHDNCRVVTFKVNVAGVTADVMVLVEGVERKNGGSEYWSFKGHSKSALHGLNCDVEGNFDTHGRHGVIKFRIY